MFCYNHSREPEGTRELTVRVQILGGSWHFVSKLISTLIRSVSSSMDVYLKSYYCSYFATVVLAYLAPRILREHYATILVGYHKP